MISISNTIIKVSEELILIVFIRHHLISSHFRRDWPKKEYKRINFNVTGSEFTNGALRSIFGNFSMLELISVIGFNWPNFYEL